MCELDKLIDKRKSISNIKDTHGESFMLEITFGEITKILNNKQTNRIMNPPFQIAINEDKIHEMIESYLSHPSFLLSKSIITIAIINIDNQNEYYIMDGQHRLEMANILYQEHHYNEKLFLVFHIIQNEDQLKELFDDLNKDSYKNHQYVSLPIFMKKKRIDIKNKLIDKYENSFALKSSKISHLITIDEFMNDAQDYFDSFTDDSTVDEIVKDINKINMEYLIKMKYLENAKDDVLDKIFYKDEKKAIDNKCVIFLKRNNFIQYLNGDDKEMFHDYRNSREKISQEMKIQIWNKEYKKKKAKCPIYNCDSILEKEKIKGFEAGHIISHANGGLSVIDNLKPICSDCNNKMGIMNWDDYENQIKHDCAWNENFDNNKYGLCFTCNKRINKNNYEFNEVKKGDRLILRVVCENCFHE